MGRVDMFFGRSDKKKGTCLNQTYLEHGWQRSKDISVHYVCPSSDALTQVTPYTWWPMGLDTSCLAGKTSAFGCFFYIAKMQKHIRLLLVEWYERSNFRNTWLPDCWVVVLLCLVLPCPWSLVPIPKWIVFDEPINYAETWHDPGHSIFP